MRCSAAWEGENAYAPDLLHARLCGSVKRGDAALATELTLGVLRWQRLLDFLLEQHLAQPIGSLDLEVLLALRMRFYRLRYMSRVPVRGQSANRSKKASAARLVNAVLRRAAQAAGQPAEQLVPDDLPAAERLGILYSHPTWMVRSRHAVTSAVWPRPTHSSPTSRRARAPRVCLARTSISERFRPSKIQTGSSRQYLSEG